MDKTRPVAVLTITGEIDVLNFRQVEGLLPALIVAHGAVAVDLAEATSSDSSGGSLLLRGRARASRSGLRTRRACPDGRIITTTSRGVQR